MNLLLAYLPYLTIVWDFHVWHFLVWGFLVWDSHFRFWLPPESGSTADVPIGNRKSPLSADLLPFPFCSVQVEPAVKQNRKQL